MEKKAQSVQGEVQHIVKDFEGRPSKDELLDVCEERFEKLFEGQDHHYSRDHLERTIEQMIEDDKLEFTGLKAPKDLLP